MSNVRSIHPGSKAGLGQPPHSLEAEMSVLGAIMLDPAVFDAVIDVLSEADFYKAAHRAIFAAMRRIVAKGQTPDVVSVSDALALAGELEDTGGEAYLGAIARDTPSTANVRVYAEIVRAHAIRRGVMAAGSRMSELAMSDREPHEVLDAAQSYLSRLAERTMHSGPTPVGDILGPVLEDLEARKERNGSLAGIGTGLADLDRLTSGLCPGRLYVLAGRPGTGKSMLALQIALHVACELQHPVLLVTLEMPAAEVVLRGCAHLERMDLGALTDARFCEDDWSRVSAAMARLRTSRLVLDETPALGILELRARARRVAREQAGLDLLVVDYLQLVTAGAENRTQQIGEVSRGLKSLAKELAMPVLACASLNRGLENRTDKRPQMSDLRESGDIESDADVIAMLYRDELYNENSLDKGAVEVLIRKNRGGGLGRFALRFAAYQARFDAMTELASWTTPTPPRKRARQQAEEENF